MPTNVQWLEQIKTEMTEFRAQYALDLAEEIAAYRTPMLTSMEALAESLTTEQGLAVSLLISAVTKQDQILSLLLSWDQILMDLRANIEFINQNGSQNAQNQQILTISAASACCEDPIITTGSPPDLCARARSVIDTVLNRADSLCALAAGSTIPSLEELRDILRRDDWSPAGRPMYTDNELLEVQGAIASRGMIGLSELCDLQNNAAVAERAYETITNAADSAGAGNAMAQEFFFNLGVPAPWDKFIRYLFPPSVVDIAFNTIINVNADLYSNEGCESTPPTGQCNNQNILVEGDTNPTIDFSWNIAPGVDGTPGDDFEVQVTSWSGSGGQLFLQSLPSLGNLGNASVGAPLRWTITPGMTGARITFVKNNEEEDSFIEYRKCLYVADGV